MSIRPVFSLILAAALFTGTAAPAPGEPLPEPLPEVVRFNRDIRPILSDNCFACHGPDAKHRKAKLRLDIEADAKLEREGATPIKPGSLEHSAVWKLITSRDADEKMPPVKSNKSLSPRQIALIKKWIEQGAKWEGHWSFLAPEKPALPAVSNAAWARTPIDRFILARLDREALSPSPEADRAALTRRVAFDVTGLPPSLAELDRFTTDKSGNWYETMVDHYLAKTAFGERMALAWMDAGRYGDTSVFHADGPRDMWPWRDWVIEAYNRNMPFDQFATEQLAGDLIPNATAMQKIASGFNRNNGTTDEGGAIDEEYRVEYVVDRVKTTANVFLGLSMECAQCHDHKYDPITQKEYYGFFAFFNQTSDPGMQTRGGNQAPVVNVPDPKKEAQAAAVAVKLAELDKQIEAHRRSVEPAFAAWVKEMETKVGGVPQVPGDMLAHFALDEGKGNAAGDSIEAKRKGAIKGKERWEAGKLGGAFRTKADTWIDFGDVANFDRTDAVSYGCWVKPDDAGVGVPLSKMDDANAYRGWDLYLNGGSVAVHIISTWPTDAIKVNTKNKIKAKEWTHVFVTYDGSSKASGIKIYFDGKEQEWTIEADALTGTTKGAAPLQVGRRHPGSPYAGLVDDVRIYGRALPAAEVAALAGADPIGPILALPAEKRTPPQVDSLRAHYLASVDKTYPKLTGDRAKMNAEIEGLRKSAVTSMIMGEQPQPRMTYLLTRGHYASPDKSEVIKPNVPKMLPPMAEGLPANRLGLAKWIVDAKNPLAARVAVNRMWAMYFGRGFVETSADFGGQGSWPTHAELLDWLAVDFRENGWDVKRALKQIMMSATYRQSSRTTPELRQRDPQNLLLARGPRFRLQGDFIRDSALAVSGLLVEQAGGPGVKPYQPELWNEVSLDGGLRFVQDKGDRLWRKSMYIYWKRSAPHPGMLLFDAPTREACVVQRPITNTPLQALYTMNDIQFFETARVLAQRMMKEGGATPRERITFAYRLATSRPPSDSAVSTLVSLYESELAKYRKTIDAAKKLIAVGDSPRDEKLDASEHAAWTMVATTILNMDATVTKY
jgi:hypothetical protein